MTYYCANCPGAITEPFNLLGRMVCPKCYAGLQGVCDGGLLDAKVVMPLEEDMKKIQAEAMKLWRSRQEKYGPTNIGRTGALGCYVRSNDKLARLHNVYMMGVGNMPDESIEDSWLDLMNYAMMGLACHRGVWPQA